MCCVIVDTCELLLQANRIRFTNCRRQHVKFRQQFGGNPIIIFVVVSLLSRWFDASVLRHCATLSISINKYNTRVRMPSRGKTLFEFRVNQRRRMFFVVKPTTVLPELSVEFVRLKPRSSSHVCLRVVRTVSKPLLEGGGEAAAAVCVSVFVRTFDSRRIKIANLSSPLISPET